MSAGRARAQAAAAEVAARQSVREVSAGLESLGACWGADDVGAAFAQRYLPAAQAAVIAIMQAAAELHAVAVELTGPDTATADAVQDKGGDHAPHDGGPGHAPPSDGVASPRALPTPGGAARTPRPLQVYAAGLVPPWTYAGSFPKADEQALRRLGDTWRTQARASSYQAAVLATSVEPVHLAGTDRTIGVRVSACVGTLTRSGALARRLAEGCSRAAELVTVAKEVMNGALEALHTRSATVIANVAGDGRSSAADLVMQLRRHQIATQAWLQALSATLAGCLSEDAFGTVLGADASDESEEAVRSGSCEDDADGIDVLIGRHAFESDRAAPPAPDPLSLAASTAYGERERAWQREEAARVLAQARNSARSGAIPRESAERLPDGLAAGVRPGDIIPALAPDPLCATRPAYQVDYCEAMGLPEPPPPECLDAFEVASLRPRHVLVDDDWQAAMPASPRRSWEPKPSKTVVPPEPPKPAAAHTRLSRPRSGRFRHPLTQFGPRDTALVPMPDGSGTAFQRALTPEECRLLLEGRSDSLRGLLYPLAQVQHLETPAALHEVLGLDIALSPDPEAPAAPARQAFDPRARWIDVLRCNGLGLDDLIVPVARPHELVADREHSGDSPGRRGDSACPPARRDSGGPPGSRAVRAHAHPWTGGGFALGSLPDRPIWEYEATALAGLTIPHLSEIWRLYATGRPPQHVATYDAVAARWSLDSGPRHQPAGQRLTNGLIAELVLPEPRRVTGNESPGAVGPATELSHEVAVVSCQVALLDRHSWVAITQQPQGTGFRTASDGTHRRVVSASRVRRLSRCATLAHWHDVRVRVLRQTSELALVEYLGGDCTEAYAAGFAQFNQGHWRTRWVPRAELRAATVLRTDYPQPTEL